MMETGRSQDTLGKIVTMAINLANENRAIVKDAGTQMTDRGEVAPEVDLNISLASAAIQVNESFS